MAIDGTFVAVSSAPPRPSPRLEVGWLPQWLGSITELTDDACARWMRDNSLTIMRAVIARGASAIVELLA